MKSEPIPHAYHSETLPRHVVLGGSDATARTAEGGALVDIAHQHQVVIEGRRVKVIREVVHEVARAALDEAVVVVEDVARAVVEHALAAPKGREALEGVQRAWRVRRFQVPAETARVR